MREGYRSLVPQLPRSLLREKATSVPTEQNSIIYSRVSKFDRKELYRGLHDNCARNATCVQVADSRWNMFALWRNNRESRPPVDFFEAEKRLNFAPKQPL